MKIVSLETFRKLPPNTLFSKYEPSAFSDLAIKGETTEHDFYATSNLSSAIDCSGSWEFAELLDRAELTGESLAVDLDTESRDGCFDPGQLFAVWEEADIKALIERLQRCVTTPSDGHVLTR